MARPPFGRVGAWRAFWGRGLWAELLGHEIGELQTALCGVAG